MGREQWKAGDPQTCWWCAWGSHISAETKCLPSKVLCQYNPQEAIKRGNQFCHVWASTRGLSSEWVDKDRLPIERLRRLVAKAASLLTEEALPPMRKGTRLDSWSQIRNNWIEAYKEEIEKSDYIKG